MTFDTVRMQLSNFYAKLNNQNSEIKSLIRIEEIMMQLERSYNMKEHENVFVVEDITEVRII